MYQLPVLPEGSWKLGWASGRTLRGVQHFSFTSINNQLFLGAKFDAGVWEFWTRDANQRLRFEDASAPCVGDLG